MFNNLSKTWRIRSSNGHFRVDYVVLSGASRPGAVGRGVIFFIFRSSPRLLLSRPAQKTNRIQYTPCCTVVCRSMKTVRRQRDRSVCRLTSADDILRTTTVGPTCRTTPSSSSPPRQFRRTTKVVLWMKRRCRCTFYANRASKYRVHNYLYTPSYT